MLAWGRGEKGGMRKRREGWHGEEERRVAWEEERMAWGRGEKGGMGKRREG